VDKLWKVDWKICAEMRKKLPGFNSSTIAHSSEHGLPTRSSTRLTYCFKKVLMAYPLRVARYIISRLYKIKNIVNNKDHAFSYVLPSENCSSLLLPASTWTTAACCSVPDTQSALQEKYPVSAMHRTGRCVCCAFRYLNASVGSTCRVANSGSLSPKKRAIVDKVGEVNLKICAQLCRRSSEKISSTIAHNAKQYFPTPQSTWVNTCFNVFLSTYPQIGACYIISRLYKIKNIVDNQWLRKTSLRTAKRGAYRVFSYEENRGSRSWYREGVIASLSRIPNTFGWIFRMLEKNLATPGKGSADGFMFLQIQASSPATRRSVERTFSHLAKSDVEESDENIYTLLTRSNEVMNAFSTPRDGTFCNVSVDKTGEVDLKICAETGKKSPPRKSFTIAHTVEHALPTASRTYLFYCLLMELLGYPQLGARYIISRLYILKNLVNNNSCQPHTLIGRCCFGLHPDRPLSEDRVQAGRFSGMVWGMQQVIQQ